MAGYSYSTEIGEKDSAAVGRALPISTKHAIEICNHIRGKKLDRAKVILTEVLAENEAIPFKRFTDGVGHRKGKVAAGRYPKKACGEILKLINSAQANAQFKGLSSSDLIVRHISAQKGSSTPRYGRRRRFSKRTSVEIVLSEVIEAKKGAKAEEKTPKDVAQAEEKKGAKPEAPKVVEEKTKQAPAPKAETTKKVEAKTTKTEAGPTKTGQKPKPAQKEQAPAEQKSQSPKQEEVKAEQ
jgi:large subunit ribosomal protein L22